MTTESPAIVEGSKLVITKGSLARDITKGMHCTVVKVIVRERKEAQVVLFFPTRIGVDGSRGSQMSFYARHINRLSDALIGMNDGNPLHHIEVRRA